MSQPSLRPFAALILASVVAVPAAGAEGSVDLQPGAARLDSYQSPAGETFFSLILRPKVPAPAAGGRDIAILVDTSASQTGVYRRMALAALDRLVAGLTAEDRALLFAVDLAAEPMADQFQAAAALGAARGKLALRVPLGSTDMQAALTRAAAAFADQASRPRHLVYIGDGLSAAELVGSAELGPLVRLLVERRIAVTSYAIGPRVDAQLLAILANQTGGLLAVARPAERGAQTGLDENRVESENVRQAEAAGDYLARAMRATVLWPVKTTWPDAMKEVYPTPLPPLRSDRATAVVGRGELAGPVRFETEVAAGAATTKLAWSADPPTASDDQAYLVRLVELARASHGLNLPTVGSAGLAEARRMIVDETTDLNRLARHAAATGSYKDAKMLAQAALRRDPNNPEAIAIQGGAARLQSAAGAAADQPWQLVQLDPVAAETTGSSQPEDPLAREGAFLDEVEARNRVIAAAVQTEVRVTLSKARHRMSTEPAAVIQDLKMLLETVREVPELEPATRAELTSRIEAGLRAASRRELEKAERDRLANEAAAAARDQQLLNERLTRDVEKERQLVERMRSLVHEAQHTADLREASSLYAESEELVGPALEELAPDTPIAKSARLWTSFVRHDADIQAIRAARHKGMIDSLRLVELSSIPFPDDPPIVYPSAEDWEDLTARRKKWASVDLSESGPAERKIRAALEEPTQFNFVDTPLSDVFDAIETLHNINIHVDQARLDEEGISTDTPVNMELSGISLKSALRLLLRDYDLTYMIADEVLLITTPTAAEDKLTTKVYPVADLVLPIQSGIGLGGIGGGGGFGGGGGGFGGGGGGFGGGGGGFGGGFGGGGGGGGGFFNVADPPAEPAQPVRTAAAKDSPNRAPAKSAARPQAIALGDTRAVDRQPAARPRGIVLDESRAPEAFWNDYFAHHVEDPARVRQTVSKLTDGRKFDQVIALCQAAIRQGQGQSWMYEAMGIAMQLAGRSQHDIERALMSAVDFSASAENLLYIAQYFARIGLNNRAVQLARQVARVEPLRVEAYVLGMKLAQRLDDLDALRWATVGVLSQAWPQKKASIRDEAVRAADAAIQRLRHDGRGAEANALRKDLDAALIRDCLVKVTWTGDADVDLLVEEPSGTVCSLRDPRTAAGGVMLGDACTHYDQASTGPAEEVYVCPQGFDGKYRALIQRVWGKVTAGKVTVDVYLHYRTPAEKHQRKQIDLVGDQAVVLFELDSGRRQEPLEAAKISTVANGQVALDRAILAQQLSAISDPAVNNAVRNRLAPDPRRLFGRAGAVGFQPVIITLPSGLNFSVTGVISADRRYVRITPSLIISDVTDVTTFTFAGASAPADGGTAPPADGGTTPPADGGTTPPTDGGTDGGA